MGIKKPLICQAGSAGAFVGSAATGRERPQHRAWMAVCQPDLMVFALCGQGEL